VRPGTLSLRTHLALVVLGAVLPSALLTGLIVRRILEENRAVLEHRLEDTARVDADALDREFNGTIRVLQTLAESPALDTGDFAGFRADAVRAVRTQPGWWAVVLLSPDGHQLVHTGLPMGEPLPGAIEPESVRQLVATRRPVVGQLTHGSRDSKLRFPIRVGVERDGRLVYVLTAMMEPESLGAVIRTHLPESEEWTRAIVDRGLLIAARSRAGDQFIGRPVTPQGAELIRNPPRRPFPGTSLEGEALYSSLGRSAYGWTTSVSVPSAVLDGPVRASVVASVSGGIVLILGGLISVLFVSRRVSRDFEAARDAAAALADGRSVVSVRPRVAEAQQVQTSLQRAAQLINDHARERDEQLQRAIAAQAQAEEANQTKDRFLAILGHELRNPLAPALTALELMKARGVPGAERERQVLHRQISHMMRLVDDLLDVSRLTRAKIDLVKRRFEARSAVDRAADMARPLIEQHQHTFTVAVPREGLPLNADEDRVVQVLVNLLTNAAKYTPRDGHVCICSRVANGFVEIACEDDGPGVPSAQVPMIFQPFAQGPRTIAQQPGGLGLGLTLARSLAELHGGGLRYEPVRPNGSRFVVSLPLAAAADFAAPAPAPVDEVPVSPRRVLLVDDNIDGLEMMKVALQGAGHVVGCATDAKTAIATVATLRPEVAVLDIGLPDIDGYQLARILRAHHPEMRLIALTGYGQDADAAAARQAGFDAHCTKPVTLAALLAEIAPTNASASPAAS
jgi:signal transduction histidine kinase/ActR/RegA family two-component response regulator